MHNDDEHCAHLKHPMQAFQTMGIGTCIAMPLLVKVHTTAGLRHATNAVCIKR